MVPDDHVFLRNIVSIQRPATARAEAGVCVVGQRVNDASRETWVEKDANYTLGSMFGLHVPKALPTVGLDARRARLGQPANGPSAQ